MSDNKQYLFTANGSYFGCCLVVLAFIAPVIYGIIDRSGVDLNAANVLMLPLCVALLLSFAAMTEACMMIKVNKYLFAYNVDKAICVSLDNIPWDNAVAIARKLYGPVFDKDCAQRFSATPKSPPLRNVFYCLVIMLFCISVVSPWYYAVDAVWSGTISSKLVAAWIFICFDVAMIVNRLFFRPSIRRFWAKTLGDDNFRSILNFELSSEEDPAQLPLSVVTDDKDLNNDRIPGYTNRIPSRKRLILTGVILIILVVWALNSRRNKPTQMSPNENRVSTERRPAK